MNRPCQPRNDTLEQLKNLVPVTLASLLAKALVLKQKFRLGFFSDSLGLHLIPVIGFQDTPVYLSQCDVIF